MQSGRVGRRSDERVLIELTATAQRHLTDLPHEHRRVHQLELGGRRCRGQHPQTPRPTSTLERRLDRVDPLRTVGVLGQELPRVMLARRVVTEIQHFAHTSPLLTLSRHLQAITRATRRPPLQAASPLRPTTRITAHPGNRITANRSRLPRAVSSCSARGDGGAEPAPCFGIALSR